MFGVIRTGGNYFLSTGVPDYLAQVLQGLLVLAAVFPPVYLERREWARRLKAARASAGAVGMRGGGDERHRSTPRSSWPGWSPQSTPLLFAASGEYMAERAGTLNISIEAMMLSGAYGRSPSPR